MKRSKWVVGLALLAVTSVFSWAAVGCGDACQENADCMLTCDCDNDGEDDWVMFHECTNGTCGSRYSADVRKGCETLCEES